MIAVCWLSEPGWPGLRDDQDNPENPLIPAIPVQTAFIMPITKITLNHSSKQWGG
jgi:hypothetical protein